MCFFFFKQKTAYEMRISDWSSDVCSSDLVIADQPLRRRFEQRRIGRRQFAVDRIRGGVERADGGDADRPALAEQIAAREGQREQASRDEPHRSEERRVGKECVSTGRSR